MTQTSQMNSEPHTRIPGAVREQFSPSGYVWLTAIGLFLYPMTLAGMAWMTSGGILGVICLATATVASYLYVRSSRRGGYIRRGIMAAIGLVAGLQMFRDIGTMINFGFWI